MLDNKEKRKRSMTIDILKISVLGPITLHGLVEAATFEKILLPYSLEISNILRKVTGQLGGYTL